MPLTRYRTAAEEGNARDWDNFVRIWVRPQSVGRNVASVEVAVFPLFLTVAFFIQSMFLYTGTEYGWVLLVVFVGFALMVSVHGLYVIFSNRSYIRMAVFSLVFGATVYMSFREIWFLQAWPHVHRHQFWSIPHTHKAKHFLLTEVHRERKTPNKSPEPTSCAVTPRADARVAPAQAVAHL